MNNDNYYESIVYIAGPMTGLPDYNYEAFNTAAAILRFAYPKILVINPAEQFDGVQTHPREDYLREDIKQLLRSDTIVMLEGWQASEGATLEFDIAQALGLEIKMLDMDRSGIILRNLDGYDIDVRDEADMDACEGCDGCDPGLVEGDTYILELPNGVIYEAEANQEGPDHMYFTVEEEADGLDNVEWADFCNTDCYVTVYEILNDVANQYDVRSAVAYRLEYVSTIEHEECNDNRPYFYIRLSSIN